MHAKYVDTAHNKATRILRNVDYTGLKRVFGTFASVAMHDILAVAGELSHETRNRLLMCRLLVKQSSIGTDTILNSMLEQPQTMQTVNDGTGLQNAIVEMSSLLGFTPLIKRVNTYDNAPLGADYVIAETCWPHIPDYSNKKNYIAKLTAWVYGNNKIKDCIDFTHLCFTDGSRNDDMSIGAGMTVYDGSNRIKLFQKIVPGKEIGSCYESEALGMQEVIAMLEMSIRVQTHRAKIAVFCDSQSVIHDIGNTHAQTTHTTIQTIRNLLWTIHNRPNVEVHIKWIPGHVGLARNEETDELAKIASKASQVNLNTTADYAIEGRVLNALLKKRAKEEDKNSWERHRRTGKKPRHFGTFCMPKKYILTKHHSHSITSTMNLLRTGHNGWSHPPYYAHINKSMSTIQKQEAQERAVRKGYANFVIATKT